MRPGSSPAASRNTKAPASKETNAIHSRQALPSTVPEDADGFCQWGAKVRSEVFQQHYIAWVSPLRECEKVSIRGRRDGREETQLAPAGISNNVLGLPVASTERTETVETDCDSAKKLLPGPAR